MFYSILYLYNIENQEVLIKFAPFKRSHFVLQTNVKTGQFIDSQCKTLSTVFLLGHLKYLLVFQDWSSKKPELNIGPERNIYKRALAPILFYDQTLRTKSLSVKYRRATTILNPGTVGFMSLLSTHYMVQSIYCKWALATNTQLPFML